MCIPQLTQPPHTKTGHHLAFQTATLYFKKHMTLLHRFDSNYFMIIGKDSYNQAA
jgi:hypothetical protein